MRTERNYWADRALNGHRRRSNKTATFYKVIGDEAGAVRMNSGRWVGFRNLRILPTDNDSFKQRWQGPPSQAIIRAMKVMDGDN